MCPLLLTTARLYNDLALKDEKVNEDALHKSNKFINRAINEIRSLSRSLSCPDEEYFDLDDLLSDLVQSISETKNVAIKFFSYGMRGKKINKDIRIAIYRIAQEQITNILKHSCASKAAVILVGTSINISLRIEDNGKGFNSKQKKSGLGLISIRARAKALHGSVTIESAPGMGCSLTVEFPMI